MESLVIWYQNSLGKLYAKRSLYFSGIHAPVDRITRRTDHCIFAEGVPLVQANIICIIGNIIPIPFILLFIKKIF